MIVACPLCGALGKAGEPCEFCGATIPQPSGNASATSIVVEKQTVSAEEFVNKISKYQRVEPWKYDLAVVSIGNLHGAINRNGDIIFPLNYNYIILLERFCLLDKDLYDKTNGNLIKNVLHEEYYSSNESVSISDGIGNQIVIEGIYDKKINYKKERWDFKVFVEFIDVDSKNNIYHGHRNKDWYKEDDIVWHSQFYRSKIIGQYNAYEWENLLISPLTGKTFSGKIDGDGNATFYNVVNIDGNWTRFDHTVQVGKDVEDPISYLREMEDNTLAEDELKTPATKREETTKENAGCAVLLLPLLVLGTGATVGVIELIRLVFS